MVTQRPLQSDIDDLANLSPSRMDLSGTWPRLRG